MQINRCRINGAGQRFKKALRQFEITNCFVGSSPTEPLILI